MVCARSGGRGGNVAKAGGTPLHLVSLWGGSSGQQMGGYRETAHKSKGGVPKGIIFIIYLLHKYIVK